MSGRQELLAAGSQGKFPSGDGHRKHTCVRAVLGGAVLAAVLCTGCSRETINYQVAESIGTLGQYENNEPVETPQMREARLLQEAQESEAEVLDGQLQEAARLAASYEYEDAIAYLQSIEQNESNADAINGAISSYQDQENALVSYTGDIPHLCFPTLIEDTSRAFDGDDNAYTYASTMLTVREFNSILQSLYDNNYVLVSLYDVAGEQTDESGVTTMTLKDLRLPAQKKPIIISQDNLNYAGIVNGDGIATGLVLDDEGKVKALYTDENGHDLKGDYDLIPVLDAFVEEHPDFSYKGARGIVSVSGTNGVFGYDISTSALTSTEENRQTVQQIAQALKEDGWLIACAGYSHSYMNEMSSSALSSDLDNWTGSAGALVGSTDILFYPYGGEVSYPSDSLTVLLDHGYLYLCGLWGDTDYMELGDGYLRQTRRFIDGYTLQNGSQYLTAFFDAGSVLDQDR